MTGTDSIWLPQHTCGSSRLGPTEPGPAHCHCFSEYTKPWLARSQERCEDCRHTFCTECNTNHSFPEVQGAFKCAPNFWPAVVHSSGNLGSLSFSSLMCKRGARSTYWAWKSSENSQVVYKWKLVLLHTDQNNICHNAVCLKWTWCGPAINTDTGMMAIIWDAGLIKISTMPSTPIALQS